MKCGQFLVYLISSCIIVRNLRKLSLNTCTLKFTKHFLHWFSLVSPNVTCYNENALNATFICLHNNNLYFLKFLLPLVYHTVLYSEQNFVKNKL